MGTLKLWGREGFANIQVPVKIRAGAQVFSLLTVLRKLEGRKKFHFSLLLWFTFKIGFSTWENNELREGRKPALKSYHGYIKRSLNSTNKRYQNQDSQFTDDAIGNQKSCVTSPRPHECAAKLDEHPGFWLLPARSPRLLAVTQAVTTTDWRF